MDSELFKYIWRHSRREQIVILGVVLLSQVFYFVSLDLPKRIVNKAIQGEGFDSPDATQSFLTITLPGWMVGGRDPVTLFPGFELSQIPYLVALSCAFLLFVLINGAFKYQINTQKGRMGERMLRRLRFELFERILRFPHAHFRRVKQAELATMIKDEVEPLGGFIGDAFVQPAFLGGQAVTALVFILVQSWYLGAVTVAVLALQMLIIPRLRRRVLVLGKRRQVTARQLAGRIAEIADGAAEVHIHDTANYERADIASRLGEIFGVRFEIYQRKFAIKFLNNLLAQTTPFLFFLIGGYLAVTGHLDIGGLVAVINAYKDLPGPIKELIDWDQQRQDVQIKYEQVVEQFTPESLLPPPGMDEDVAADAHLESPVVVSNLTLAEEGGGRLEGLSFRFELDEHVAVIGQSGSGKETLAHAFTGLIQPAGGSIRFGNVELAKLPDAVTGRRISYAGQDSYVFPTSVRDNLIYGLKHRPVREPSYAPEALRERERALMEARRTGNPILDITADWIDYEAAGASGPEDIDDRLCEILSVVELDEDVYQLGLRRTLQAPGSPIMERRPELPERLIEARAALHARLQEPGFANLVESFDPQRYNKNMSLAENLLFGTPVGSEFAPDRIGTNPYVLATFERVGMAEDLLEMGRKIAETMVEIFADLPPGHPFFDQFSFIAAEDLPEFRAILGRLGKSGGTLTAADRARLMALPFLYIEARHRLGLVDGPMEQRLLEARRAFADHLPAEFAESVEFYDPQRYNMHATLQDNILFGRLVYGQAQAAQLVGRLTGEVLRELDLRGAVIEVGLDFEVGTAGKRLTGAQRHKLALGRAVVKTPDLLIINEVTAGLDHATQARIVDRILSHREGRAVLWVLERADLAGKFDQVIEIRDGQMADSQKAAA